MRPKLINEVVKAIENYADIHRDEAENREDSRHQLAAMSCDNLAEQVSKLNFDDDLVDRIAELSDQPILPGIVTVETAQALTDVGINWTGFTVNGFMADVITRIAARLS